MRILRQHEPGRWVIGAATEIRGYQVSTSRRGCPKAVCLWGFATMILRELFAECDAVLDRLAEAHPAERATLGGLRFRLACADAALLQAGLILSGKPPSVDRPGRGSAAVASGGAASAAPGAEPPGRDQTVLVQNAITALNTARSVDGPALSEAQNAYIEQAEGDLEAFMRAASERHRTTLVFECHSAGCAAFFDLDSARGIHNGHGIIRCPRCWSTSVRVGLRPNVRKAGAA
jgi:hypothetical protein